VTTLQRNAPNNLRQREKSFTRMSTISYRFVAWLREIFSRARRSQTTSAAPSSDRPTDGTNPTEAFAGLSDDAWFGILADSITTPVQRGMTLPGFPAEATQQQFVGSAGRHSLLEAFNFYKVVKAYAETMGHSVNTHTRIMDFGCGWGRMLRFFLKDVNAKNLFGIDVDPNIIAFCQGAFAYGQFSVVPALPPVKFPTGFFDLIYGYSVFSHLNEDTHLKWIAEFSRVIKAGGLLLVTTQGRGFIDFCQTLRQQATFETEWHRALARSFVDRDQALNDYDAGTFLHSPSGGGDFRPSSFYGETLIPKRYVVDVWTKWLRFVDFRDDPQFLPQALVVMQK
jgi:SAM-dependent methyltransferase